MKYFALLLLILAPALIQGEFVEHQFEQRLMPIDVLDTRTWQNRYWLDDSSYTPGGPLFVVTTASWAFHFDEWLTNTHFYDLGREMNALLLHTEHRFYGESRPTQNTSFLNLQFLDSRYAVDDVAALVTSIRNQYSAGSVIVHGFDHGGAIAVWLSHRYPSLVDGVWASSATLLAQKDYSVFLTNVAEDIRVIGGQECYHQTELAFARMESLYASGNFQTLEASFNLCDNFTPGDMVEGAVFFAAYSLALGQLIRYSHRMGVDTLCNYYDSHDDPMDALASFINQLLPDCVPVSAYSQLTIFQDVNWDSAGHVNGMRQITYQFCRELGWYVSSSGADHPFGHRFPLELFQQQCFYLLGPIFTTANMMAFMDETNRLFGGLQPNITNAYFTVGEFDPSKDLGVLESYGDTIHVDIIPDFGAGAEILSWGAYPQEQIAAVHTRLRELITEWIS